MGTMRALRAIAVNLGEYNVATCNCHHAAMAVYNACAQESAKISRMPNQMLTWGAKIMSLLGLDAGDSSESAGLKSESRSGQWVFTLPSSGLSRSSSTRLNSRL